VVTRIKPVKILFHFLQLDLSIIGKGLLGLIMPSLYLLCSYAFLDGRVPLLWTEIFPAMSFHCLEKRVAGCIDNPVD
jgi:hypothetical protein